MHILTKLMQQSSCWLLYVESLMNLNTFDHETYVGLKSISEKFPHYLYVSLLLTKEDEYQNHFILNPYEASK